MSEQNSNGQDKAVMSIDYAEVHAAAAHPSLFVVGELGRGKSYGRFGSLEGGE